MDGHLDKGLVYVGKVVEINPIPNADFIVSATVVCGEGGRWRGVVKRDDFVINSLCIVFLPDAQLNEVDHARFPFMKDSSWRVKMRRFKGAPSEVLIASFFPLDTMGAFVGQDITIAENVTKYHKPVPSHLNGIAKGNFPDFIPKTDEMNYQRVPEEIEKLVGKPYYITEKADGSSTTAFKWKGNFGLCSRNLELERNENNGYWKVAAKYKVEENLPEGVAIQWETCGPGIQSNPMGLSEIDGFAFSAYNIHDKRYLELEEFYDLCEKMKFPTCKLINQGLDFYDDDMETLGEGFYSNRHPREGVVIRSKYNLNGHGPISFKVINLGYER